MFLGSPLSNVPTPKRDQFWRLVRDVECLARSWTVPCGSNSENRMLVRWNFRRPSMKRYFSTHSSYTRLQGSTWAQSNSAYPIGVLVNCLGRLMIYIKVSVAKSSFAYFSSKVAHHFTAHCECSFFLMHTRRPVFQSDPSSQRCSRFIFHEGVKDPHGRPLMDAVFSLTSWNDDRYGFKGVEDADLHLKLEGRCLLCDILVCSVVVLTQVILQVVWVDVQDLFVANVSGTNDIQCCFFLTSLVPSPFT